MTNLTTCRFNKILKMVLLRSDSGAIYKRLTDPSNIRSIASLRSNGFSKLLINTALVIFLLNKLSTWSFMSDCSGDITTVNPPSLSPCINAGN